MGLPKTMRAILVAAAVIFAAQLFSVEGVITFRPINYVAGPESDSKMGSYKNAAVAANGPGCADIGVQILKEGGSAVDAAIATLLCDGVVSVHSMGIGGGFLMTIYDAKTNKVECLNSREEAPSKSSQDMFKTADEARVGGKAIAVPGELYGYWVAHKKYGKLPWARLFEPTIKLCEEGTPVNHYIAKSLQQMEKEILAEPTMREILIDPATNRTWAANAKIKRPVLAETLKKIAAEGPINTFYNGEMGKKIVQEIKDMGGVMEMEDFQNYRPKWVKPISAKIGGKTLYSVPPPGSGVLLAFIMRILQDLLPTPDPQIFWQRLVETFKWAYARRSELGDPDMVNITTELNYLQSPKYINYVRKMIRDDWTTNNSTFYGGEHKAVDDSGTANVCVYAPDGSAVTVTSTINLYLGAMRRSPSTGIIFNDEMDDFSSPKFQNGFAMPPSVRNFIAPHKRPMSSMAPSIIVNNKSKRVRMLAGSAGGTKITTAIATTMALHLFANFNIKQAIDARRIHHQLMPMVADYETGVDPELLDFLRERGHKLEQGNRMDSTVTAITIQRRKGKLLINANSDGRREGSVAGF